MKLAPVPHTKLETWYVATQQVQWPDDLRKAAAEETGPSNIHLAVQLGVTNIPIYDNAGCEQGSTCSLRVTDINVARRIVQDKMINVSCSGYWLQFGPNAVPMFYGTREMIPFWMP